MNGPLCPDLHFRVMGQKLIIPNVVHYVPQWPNATFGNTKVANVNFTVKPIYILVKIRLILAKIYYEETNFVYQYVSSKICYPPKYF
jgi:hypothetical protein